MALNFLGIGFSFGAKDMGLSKTQEKIAGGFTNIVTQMSNLHEVSKPAFSGLNTSLDVIDGVLGEQEHAVGKWAQNWADKIDEVALLPDTLKQKFEPFHDAVRTGGKAVSMAWNSTFGESFKAVGEKADVLKERFSGFVTAVEPLTSKFRQVFKSGAEAISPMTDRLTDLGGQALKMKESWQIGVFDTLKKAGHFFKSRGEDIAKTQTVIYEGFGEIKNVVGKMNELLRVNKLRGFLEAISVGLLSKISDGIKKIGTEGINLTNGLEAQGVALNKSARQTAANLGLTGKELKAVSGQAAGMAYGMNISADTATQAIVGMKVATEELGAVGIKSASDLAKLAEVTGLNSQQFSKMLKEMKNLGLGKDEIGGIVGSFQAMGAATQDVGGALNSIPEVMELIQTKAALMGQEMDPKRLASFAKQTAGLAAGLGKFGVSAEKARQISMGLASSQVEAKKQFAGLFAGTAQDLPEFIKELSIMGMSTDDAFAMMEKGPAGMVEGIQTMLDSAKKSGADMTQVTNFFRARMEKAGIANADVLVNFLTKGDDAAKEIMKTSQKTTASLGKLAKEGFSSGITLQESFDRAKDGMVTSFRAIGGARQRFVANSVKEFAKFTKTLKGVVKKGGPMAELVKKMSDVHSLGAAGLLPETLQPMAVMFGTITSELGPLLGALGGLIYFFGPVGALLGAATGGFIALTAAVADAYIKIGKLPEDELKMLKSSLDLGPEADRMTVAFASVASDIEGGLEGITKVITNWLDNLFVKEPEKKQNSFLRSLAGFISKIFMAFAKSAGKIAASLAGAFARIDWGGLLSSVMESLQSINWAKALTTIADGLASILHGSNDLLKKINFGKIASMILEMLGKGLTALGSKEVGNFLGTIGKFLIDRVSILGNALVDVVEAALEWLGKTDLSGKLAGIIDNILNVGASILEGLLPLVGEMLQRIPGLIKKLVPVVLKVFQELPPKLGKILEGLGPRISEAVKKFMPQLLVALGAIIEFIKTDLPPMLMAAIPVILSGLGTLLKGAVGLLKDVLFGALDGVGDWLKEKFPAFAGVIDVVIDSIKGPIKLLYKAVVKIIDGIVKTVTWFFGILEAGWHHLFGNSWILDTFTEVWDTIVSLWDFVGKVVDKWVKTVTRTFDKFFKMLRKGWDSIKRKAKHVWDSIKSAVADAIAFVQTKFQDMKTKLAGVFDGIYDKVKEVFDKVKTKISGTWDSIKTTWEGAKTWFSGIFDGVYQAVAGPDSPWEKIKGYITGIWDGEGGIKEKWGKAKNFFVNMFDNIGKVLKDSMQQMKAKLGDALGPLIDLFDTIWKIVEKLWVNSMHHEAEDSMKETVKVHQKGIPDINKELATVGAAIGANFVGAYDKAIEDTKLFKKNVIPLIADVADGIAEAFHKGLEPVADMVDILAEGLAGMLTQLEMQVAQAKLAMGVLEASQNEAARAIRESGRERDKADELELKMPPGLRGLESAVHKPHWFYNSADGMVVQMQRQTTAIVTAINSMGVLLAKQTASIAAGSGQGTGAKFRSTEVAKRVASKASTVGTRGNTGGNTAPR